MSAPLACIFGCEGLQLTPSEKHFFKASNPWGFILFARNISNPDQVRALTSELRATVGRQTPILIDQEGGRVQRLRAPNWLEWLPPLDQINQTQPEHTLEAITLRYRLIAAELHDLGIDVNCAPMLDIATDKTHEIIKNRCFGRDAKTVATIGRAAADGLLAGGVLPIIKHIPGHGRASIDTHFDLPILDTPLETLRASDFLPFKKLSDLPMAMTAHIIYHAVDPDHCATHSRAIINIIRTEMAFDGLLMTDDLSMKALKGSFTDRCIQAFKAGCDIILHCNGSMEEMAEIAQAAPKLTGIAQKRAKAALTWRKNPLPFDIKAAKARFQTLMHQG